MTNYIENTDAIVKNPEDAGCDEDTVKQFMKTVGSCGKEGTAWII